MKLIDILDIAKFYYKLSQTTYNMKQMELYGVGYTYNPKGVI